MRFTSASCKISQHSFRVQKYSFSPRMAETEWARSWFDDWWVLCSFAWAHHKTNLPVDEKLPKSRRSDEKHSGDEIPFIKAQGVCLQTIAQVASQKVAIQLWRSVFHKTKPSNVNCDAIREKRDVNNQLPLLQMHNAHFKRSHTRN